MVAASILASVYLLASKSPRREICGVVDSVGGVHPILNVSTKANEFIFSRQMYGRVQRQIKDSGARIVCVYHSHINGDPEPSIEDLHGMRATGLDYLIVANNTYTYTRFSDALIS